MEHQASLHRPLYNCSFDITAVKTTRPWLELLWGKVSMILNSAIVQKKKRNCRSWLKQRGGGI